MLRGFHGIQGWPQFLLRIFRHTTEKSSAKNEKEESGPVPLPLKPSIQCLVAAWAGAASNSQKNNGSSLSSCLKKIMCGMHAWHVKLVAAESSKEFAEKVKKDAASTATGWLEDVGKGKEEVWDSLQIGISDNCCCNFLLFLIT